MVLIAAPRTSLVGFKSSTLCLQVNLQTSVRSSLLPVATCAQLLPRPQRRFRIVLTSAPPPPRCSDGLSSTRVLPCCPYAGACVGCTHVSSQPSSLAFNFGWMARLPPAVLHLSTRRRGVSGPLHIPLLVISFNLEEKKETQAEAAVSTPHLKAATWTCTPFFFTSILSEWGVGRGRGSAGQPGTVEAGEREK